MNTKLPKVRTSVIWTITLVIAVGGVLIFLATDGFTQPKSAFSPSNQQVVKEPSTYAFAVWTPSNLSVTLSPGETKTVTATLQFLKDAAPPPTVVVSPELAPFVTVERDSVVGISFPRGNTEYSFRFRFLIPIGAHDQAVSAMATASAAKSLPIILNVLSPGPDGVISTANEDTTLVGNSKNGHVNLTWEPEEGAAQYVVFRSVSSSGPWIEIGRRSADGSDAVDFAPNLKLENICYRIQALDSNGQAIRN